jgi:hypothetical protein
MTPYLVLSISLIIANVIALSLAGIPTLMAGLITAGIEFLAVIGLALRILRQAKED